jgi:hypothetical protein
MGRVEKPKILEALPLIEVKVLVRSPYMNISPEISLVLRRYGGISPQPTSCKFVLKSNVRRASSHHQLYNGFDHSLSQKHMLNLIALEKFNHKILFQGSKS